MRGPYSDTFDLFFPSWGDMGWNEDFHNGFMAGYSVMVFMIFCMFLAVMIYLTCLKPGQPTAILLVAMFLVWLYGLLTMLDYLYVTAYWSKHLWQFTLPTWEEMGWNLDYYYGMNTGLGFFGVMFFGVVLVCDVYALYKTSSDFATLMFVWDAFLFTWSVFLLVAYGRYLEYLWATF